MPRYFQIELENKVEVRHELAEKKRLHVKKIGHGFITTPSVWSYSGGFQRRAKCLECNFANGLCELSTLNRSNLELEGSGLTSTSGSSISSSTPWRAYPQKTDMRNVQGGWDMREVLTTMDFVEVGQLGEGMRVSEGNEDDAMMRVC